MMTVNEYAIDMSKTVKEILAICESLDINATDGDYELNDDEIILLDNEIANKEEDTDTLEDTEQLEDDYEDSYEEELEEIKEIPSPKKKTKQFKQKNKKKDFAKQKKEMYKHKEKLQSK